MATKGKSVPQGMHSITPSLVCKDSVKAMAFYEKAFGAKVKTPMFGPDGKTVIHAEVQIGDSLFHLTDESASMAGGPRSPKTVGGLSTTLQIYMEDVDRLWKKATDAGAQVAMPLADMFWGDRYGVVIDPEGYRWALAEHKLDLTAEEIAKGQKEFYARMTPPQQPRA